MNPNISASLLKDFDKFTSGTLCGEYFKQNHVLKSVVKEPTPAMKLGQYFEYLATGATLRDGTIPEPDRTQAGELTAPYKVIKKQSEHFKTHQKYYDIQIISTGKVLEYKPNEETNAKGILDIECTLRSEKAIIDLKTSGLIDNKWEEYGWSYENLDSKKQLLLQAPFYKYLWRKLFNEDVDFYFMIYASTNNWMSKMVKVTVADETLEQLEGRILFTSEMIDYHIKTDSFTPIPSIENCHDCPVNDCPFRTFSPAIYNITY